MSYGTYLGHNYSPFFSGIPFHECFAPYELRWIIGKCISSQFLKAAHSSK